MAYTDPEILDRLAEHRHPPALREDLHGPRRCDSCGLALDPNVDGLRYRHRRCPPPPTPAEIGRIRALLARTAA